MTPKSPSEHRQAERRTAILEAAGRVFFSKGFEGATTLDIATAAGVSKRDLYALFPTKDLILATLIASSVEQFTAPVQFRAPQSRAEALATLEAFARGFLTFLLSPDPVSLYRLAIATAERNPAAGRALKTAGIEATVQRIEAYVGAAAEAGHLALRPADVRFAVVAFLNSTIGRLQMQRLLEPASQVEPQQIEANVAAALRVLLALEQKS
jgi:TetR/AcrR family transcriptional regulator, mexJK operon transcriptional repressor